MPSLEWVEVLGDKKTVPVAVADKLVCDARPDCAAPQPSESESAKKRKITPPPSASTSLAAKKKKKSGQLTLGAFFGVQTAAPTPSAPKSKKAGNAGKTKHSKKAGDSSIKKAKNHGFASAKKHTSGSISPLAAIDGLDEARKAELRDIVMGKVGAFSAASMPENLNVNLVDKFGSSGSQSDTSTALHGTDTVHGTEKQKETEPDELPAKLSAGTETASRPEQSPQVTLKTADIHATECGSDEEMDAEPMTSVLSVDSTRCTEARLTTLSSLQPTNPESERSALTVATERSDQTFVQTDCSASALMAVSGADGHLESTEIGPEHVLTTTSAGSKEGSEHAKKDYETAAPGSTTNQDEKHEKKEDPLLIGVTIAKEAEHGVSNLESTQPMPPAASSKVAVVDITATDSEDQTPVPTVKELSDEQRLIIEKHERMRQAYCRRANELLLRSRSGLAEEDFSIPLPEATEIPATVSVSEDQFPDFAVKALSAMVEGRKDTLDKLSTTATETLNLIYDTTRFSIASTSQKLKLIASRKSYIKNPSAAAGIAIKQAPVDVFQDDNPDRMWRWEVTLVDLLPQECVVKVKRSRAARKKLGSHFNTLARLLAAMREADKAITDGVVSKVDTALARVSQEEEKTLKYEREEEKARLASEAKQKKEEAQALKKLEMQRESEEKRKEKERKKREIEARKREEAAGKEEAKKKKEEEEKAKQARERAASQKQTAALMSFFGSNRPKKATPKAAATVPPPPAAVEAPVEVPISRPHCSPAQTFDVDKFRSSINGDHAARTHEPLKRTLRHPAKKGSRRRVKMVKMPVYVTVYPEDGFATQPYSELRNADIRNKFKFLLFHEDVRPPYHGTWSKQSDTVTGKTPFGKDTSSLDYDNDSEGEWEEGDDEIGEDVENEHGDEEDDKEEDEGELEEDGWLAPDDEVDEELDEETKLLRRKQLELSAAVDRRQEELTVCIIAPQAAHTLTAGVSAMKDPDVKGFTEGFEASSGRDLLEKHRLIQVNDLPVFLDAFPPTLVEENEPSGELALLEQSDKKSPTTHLPSDNDMKAIASFVHHSTIGSKEKLVDEIRNQLKSISASRAQTMRVLDSIAEKKKHLVTGGALWEVKTDALERLNLVDRLKSAMENMEDLKQQAIKTAARFVHHSTYKSKDKVVEELRTAHPSVTSSRADAVRLVESIAEKKKDPKHGTFWEVRESIRDELGLSDLAPGPPKPPGSSPGVVEAASTDVKSKRDEDMSPPCLQSTTVGSPSEAVVNSVDEIASSDVGGGASKKRPASAPPAASVKLLASFLKKRKC